MNTVAKLIVILTVLLIAITISAIIGLIITSLIVWVASGLFNCNLADKFWYIFGAYYLFILLFHRPQFTVNSND